MLHICYIIWKFKSPKFFTRMGGAENQLRKLINEVKDSENVKITLLARKTKDDLRFESIAPNINIYRIYSTQLPILRLILFTINLFFYLIYLNLKNRINVIHLQLPDVFIITVYYIRWLLKIPVISRVAGDELSPTHKKGLWLKNRLIVRYFMLKMDAIHTLTPYAYKLAEKLNFSKNKIFLIPNGVNVARERRDYSNLTQKLLYVGAIEFFPDKQIMEIKNLVYLIDSFNQVLKKIPKLQLILVGEGNYRNHLIEYVKKLGISSNVTFTGYQINVKKYLLEADIFINPSHAEGMPNTVLEAMSNGVYVLCSNIAQHEFVIANNKYGNLFNHKSKIDLVNKITDFYKSPDKYTKKGEKARQYLKENLSIPITVERITNMYIQVIRNFKS